MSAAADPKAGSEQRADESAAASKAPKKGDPRIIVNLPNALTALRLLLCFAFFGILIYASGRLRLAVDDVGDLAWHHLPSSLRMAHAELHGRLLVPVPEGTPGISSFPAYALDDSPNGPDRGLALLFDIAFAIFFLAAITDTLDGQIARRWGLETDFGRIADPFVDKIMIIGALVLLMPLTVYIAGWMVVLVLARELLVSGIRGFAESRGVAFPSSFWGKTKMVSQTLFVGASVLYIGHPEIAWWRDYFFLPLLWLAIGTTVLSGMVYLTSARKVLSMARAGGAA